jgi:hypothetical protein
MFPEVQQFLYDQSLFKKRLERLRFRWKGRRYWTDTDKNQIRFMTYTADSQCKFHQNPPTFRIRNVRMDTSQCVFTLFLGGNNTEKGNVDFLWNVHFQDRGRRRENTKRVQTTRRVLKPRVYGGRYRNPRISAGQQKTTTNAIWGLEVVGFHCRKHMATSGSASSFHYGTTHIKRIPQTV